MTLPVAGAPDMVAVTVNVMVEPATVSRISGLDEVRRSVGPCAAPTANNVPPFNVYTEPSGPTIVGTYGSPIPGVSATACDRVFDPTFQRYNRPSSLVKKILPVAGLTAAVLMHHSRTALGNIGEKTSGSGVGPVTVRTSRIST